MRVAGARLLKLADLRFWERSARGKYDVIGVDFYQESVRRFARNRRLKAIHDRKVRWRKVKPD
jgi:hypothetical protein